MEQAARSGKQNIAEGYTLLTFCQMESYLLNKQISALKEKFIHEGGFRENLFRQRLEFKRKKSIRS